MRDDQKTKAELLKEVNTLHKCLAKLRQTEEALRESEEKWRSLLNNTPDIVMIVDREGTLRFINHTVPGITEQEATGKRIYDYISPEYHDTMRKDLERIFQTGHGASQEISGVGPHGGLSWYQADLGPIRQDGCIVAASIVTRDITDRRRAEDALRLRNVAIESSINGIAFVDVQGNLFHVNDSFLKLWGYSDEKQVLGKPAVGFWADVDKAAEIREIVNNKGSWTGELVAKKKDGSYFDVELSASLVKDENANPVCSMASFVDITERRNTEKSLRESEERLRVALSAAQMGTWRFDPLTNQDTRDASLNRILGLEAIESTQPVDNFLQRVHPEDRDMVDAEIQHSLHERRTYLAEFRIVRPDGTVRWLQDQGKPFYDEDDHILYLTGAVIDITERKRAEEVIRESEKRYRALFQGAAEGIIVADIETTQFKYVNPAICKMLGYTEEELKLLGVRDIHPKEDLEYVISEFKAQTKEERMLSQSIPCLRKDGTIIYADINSTNLLIDGRECNVGFFTDITERKKAKEKLQESEGKYRTLLENLPQKIFFKDRNSVYVSCNDNLARDLKIKSEEIAGKTDYDFFPKELAEKYRADDKRVMESGEVKDIEEKYIQDGQEVFVHTVKTPVKDEQGYAVGVLGIFWDITEHKRAEDALRESEERYRILVENQTDMVVKFNLDGVLLFVSPSYCKIFGKSQDDLIGNRFMPLIHEQDRERVAELLKNVYKPPYTAYVEERALTKDGWRWQAWLSTAVLNSEKKAEAVIGVGRDITDRKRAEDALRESEKRFREIFENTAVGVYRTTPDGQILMANPALVHMLGYSSFEKLSKRNLEEEGFEPQYKRSMFKEEIEREGRIVSSESIWITQDGKRLYVIENARAVRDKDGKTLYYEGTVENITKSKQAEEELDMFRERMARAERLASVGTLSAIMAHTLNNPLTAIQLSIQNAMAESKKTPRQSTITKFLKDSLRAVSEVSSTVRSLGKFASESSKEIIIEVNLKAVAERTVKLLSESARRAKMSLHLKGMEKLPPIYSNEKDLEQLFFSLVENAIQAADGKRSHQLIISGAVKDQHIELRFTDDCRGIASENLDRIFEPFFTTNPPGEGTGLGLCIVDRFVSEAGGNIRVESKAGKGSTFFVTLPISRGGRY
ncbi:MAG: PAS domain S-box protein [Phycisphaerae bacterium]|nr:PAS domain S-box protein [Phycisphaerae bacterium]